MANQSNGANLGFETALWRAADAFRSNMDAAEYKHVVLGIIFLKYISDAFEEQHGSPWAPPVIPWLGAISKGKVPGPRR
jgi:type I restriction-modification system DNA methylase subunit